LGGALHNRIADHESFILGFDLVQKEFHEAPSANVVHIEHLEYNRHDVFGGRTHIL